MDQDHQGDERSLELRYEQSTGALLGRVEGGEWELLDPRGLGKHERAADLSLLLAAAGEGVVLPNADRRAAVSSKSVDPAVRTAARRAVAQMRSRNELTPEQAAAMTRFLDG